MVAHGQDPYNVKMVVRRSVTLNEEAVLRVTHLLCRLGMQDMISSVTVLTNDADTPPDRISTLWDRYREAINSGLAMSGNTSFKDNRDVFTYLPWACYSTRYDVALPYILAYIASDPSQLLTTLADSTDDGTFSMGVNSWRLAQILSNLINGRRYAEANSLVDRVKWGESSGLTMEKVFASRHWGQPHWVTASEAIEAVEFFHSLGFSYQAISTHGLTNRFAREYLCTKDVNWWKSLKPNYNSRRVMVLLSSNLLNWRSMRSAVIYSWDRDEDSQRDLLLVYLVNNGLETEASLYQDLGTDKDYFTESYARTVIRFLGKATAGRTITHESASQVTRSAVHANNTIVLKVLAEFGMVDWILAFSCAMQTNATRKRTFIKMAKYMVRESEPKRTKRLE